METSGELVPYSSEARQILLRHRNIVVVYDDHSNQLTTEELNSGELSECPYCHRPFETSPDHDELHDDLDFVSPQYFRKLEASRGSRAGSEQSSRPPSPPWRLVEPKKPRVSQGRDEYIEAEPPSSNKRGGISSESFAPGHYKTFYVEEKELGRGGKGVVLLVRHVLDGVSLGRHACKRIPVGNDHRWLENVLTEVKLLQDISHENLVAYRYSWLEDFQATVFTPRTPHLFILQQYCNSGTLLDYVLHSEDEAHQSSLTTSGRRASLLEARRNSHQRHHARRLPLEDILSFFKDITSGLAHLHANNYIHRDLKPQNCLLHNTGNSLRVLVSDFGEMQAVGIPRGSDATGYTGTMSFTAPEILERKPSGMLGDFTFKSDVFSLGMVMFFMCFGRLPYLHANLEDDAQEDLDRLRAEVLAWQGMKSLRKERGDLPDQLYENLQLLLSSEPSQRPSTADILRRIRTGSSFHEHVTTSPVKERFPSPDFSFTKDRSRSPEPIVGNGWHEAPPNAPPPMTRKPSSEARKMSSTKRSGPNIDSKELIKPEARSLPDPMTPRASPVGRTSSQVPMLMPPPDTSLSHRTTRLVKRHESVMAVKLLVFLVKCWMLMSSCASTRPKSEILYPLLAAAAIDLTGYIRDAWSSIALIVAHVSVVLILERQSLLCQTQFSDFTPAGD